MAAARHKASLPEAAPVRLYPRARPLDRLRPPDSSEARPAAAAGIGGLFAESWGPVSGLAAAAGLSPQGPLVLPGRWVIR
jgi:protease-4